MKRGWKKGFRYIQETDSNQETLETAIQKGFVGSSYCARGEREKERDREGREKEAQTEPKMGLFCCVAKTHGSASR